MFRMYQMQGRHRVAFFTNNVFSPEIGVGEVDMVPGPWVAGGVFP